MFKELGISVVPKMAVVEENLTPDSPLVSGVKVVYKKVVPLQIREEVWSLRHREGEFPYTTSVSAGGVSAEFNITSRRARISLKGFGWERGFLTDFLEVIRVDDVVWDIGANRGLYTVFAAKKIEKGNVVGFEPDPDVFQELASNVALNNLSGNVHLRKYALGNEIGSLTLYTDNSPRQKSASLKPVLNYGAQVSVPVLTADYLVETGEIAAPTIVKLDVEGAEGVVLEGMRGLLASDARPRHLFVEIHNSDFLREFGTDARSICSSVIEVGYEVVSARERFSEYLCHFAAI